MKNKDPKLTLVGAGPGDPDLITLKGIKALREADVVLYDALINTELLEHSPFAVKKYVGKRKGDHSFTQEKINEMIVEYAYNYGHVVRLKGGDPFIFGRGSEELEYAATFGIPGEVVPGISSSSAVPAAMGISLTQRHVSESVWVLTGATTGRTMSNDIRLAAQSTATVVILMGMGKLEQIAREFQKWGKGDTPVAIIQSGTNKDEKVGSGTVDNMVQFSHDKNLGSPAIIVIGDVVKHSVKLRALYDEYSPTLKMA